MIDVEIEAELRSSFRDTCFRAKVIVHEVGMMPDHVHLAVSIPPESSISSFMRTIKTSATSHIKRAARSPNGQFFGWQNEYGIFSFSERSLPDVAAYIANQREHHANNTLRPIFERLERPYPAERNPGGVTTS